MDKRFLLLGIGNVLWADEGFGVRCLEHISEHYSFAENVSLLDGGTQGIYLLQHVQDADILVVFDAIDYGLKPGTLKLVRDDEVPKYMGAKKMSLHQTGFQEVLAMSEFTGHYPQEILLIGVQPDILEDFGGSLTDGVRQQIQPAVDVALKFLAERGVHPLPAGSDANSRVASISPELAISEYEEGRPSEDAAFRFGDARFIPAPENNL
ncbi:MAG: HyaD/HybD family hydrogenase maturation endopeptidase [Oceanospirillaceae bacterium]|nr:HyaD/HybD family hydrogenase maturation endopeptidase [Oceanospirillaceae bacterium]MBT13607.1 HyaD/HybD family hydrogenase maturation endopeptidase [Oceanospirillaceae bacterium]|tara:strand:+ start:11210 stop:11836 length:627 start_codon:yes stop_codon:yes gene_type:complete